jgi:hypothetical protein
MWSVWRIDVYWGECHGAHAVIDELSALPALVARAPWLTITTPDTGAADGVLDTKRERVFT